MDGPPSHGWPLTPSQPRELSSKADASVDEHSTSRRVLSAHSTGPILWAAGTTSRTEDLRLVSGPGRRTVEYPRSCSATTELPKSLTPESIAASCTNAPASHNSRRIPPVPAKQPNDSPKLITALAHVEEPTGHSRPSSLKVTSPLTHPNGVALFPNLSTIEQEAMSREAFYQAEGAILVDTASTAEQYGPSTRRPSPGPIDSGYESDNLGSDTTSLSPSVQNYMYENGRRYHSFREGRYNFPNDEPEQEREDMKHAMIKLLCHQQLHFAPLEVRVQQILDIGTGTGRWAIEMGDAYRCAEVVGIDLSPIQPMWLPPNVSFLVDDVESPWVYPPNHFNYIHSRHTVMAIKDWGQFFRRSFEHLKPSGWIGLQEVHHLPMFASNKPVPLEHPIAQYWATVADGLANLGLDFHIAGGGRLARMLRDAGFVNVTERVLQIPIGQWPENELLKAMGRYWRTILIDGLQAIALGPLTRGLGWALEQVEVFLVQVRQAYLNDTMMMYMPLHVIYAQRPALHI